MMTVLALASLAGAFVALLWVIPTTNLLPLALVVTALVPVGRLPVPEIVTVVSPGAVVVVVWLMRRDRVGLEPAPRAVTVLGLALGVWLVVSCALGTSLERGAGWSTAFAVLVLLPTMSRRLAPDEARRLVDTWCWTSAALAVFGIPERAFELNPVYGAVFLHGDYPLVQYWSSYRITTTLGHPLNNALFFAVGTVLAVGAYVERGRRVHVAAATLGLVAVFLTLSRGGVLAVAVGVVVVTLAPVARRARESAPSRSGPRRLWALTAVLLGLAAVATAPAFQDRLQSSNGIASARARDALGSVVWSASRGVDHLGSGPGTSNYLLQRIGTPTVVENSWFQLLLSLGLPGVALVLALVTVSVVLAVRGGAVAAGGALAALATAAAGFNWIESDRPGMVFLGLLLAVCSATKASRDPEHHDPAQSLPGRDAGRAHSVFST